MNNNISPLNSLVAALQKTIGFNYIEIYESRDGECSLISTPPTYTFSDCITHESDERFSETLFLSTMRDDCEVELQFNSKSFGKILAFCLIKKWNSKKYVFLFYFKKENLDKSKIEAKFEEIWGVYRESCFK